MADIDKLTGDTAAWLFAILNAARGPVPLKVARLAGHMATRLMGTAEDTAAAWGRAVRGSVARGHVVDDGEALTLAQTDLVKTMIEQMRGTEYPRLAPKYLARARKALVDRG